MNTLGFLNMHWFGCIILNDSRCLGRYYYIWNVHLLANNVKINQLIYIVIVIRRVPQLQKFESQIKTAAVCNLPCQIKGTASKKICRKKAAIQFILVEADLLSFTEATTYIMMVFRPVRHSTFIISINQISPFFTIIY